jgi:hypothetical protein
MPQVTMDRVRFQEVRAYGADVGFVRLSVTAWTPAGALVHDLGREQLQVLEEGVPQ